jgi:hypothetical protein
MDFDLRENPEGEMWDYDDDREPDITKRTHFRIIPLTPTLTAQAWKDATPKAVNVNGRYRRQVDVPTPDVGLYQQAIFRLCCTGWENITDQDKQPVPFTDETKRLISLRHSGAVQFVNDIAEMLGRMTVERLQEERERFRGPVPLQSGSSESGLRSMPEAL